jgi:hypothetical protein
VDALDTGCRGRELRKGGDNFGGGADMYAFNLVLPFGLILSGAFARFIAGCPVVGVLDLGNGRFGVLARGTGMFEAAFLV